MIKVLVAEENVAEANKYCRYLSKCRDLKIKTVNSGDQALSTYLKIKPNIFILDSHFNDINSTEIIDRLSITYNEGNNSNILLTANSAEEQVTFHHKDMDEEAIRSSLRTSLKPLNRKRHILQNHPIVMQFEQGKNISPGRFLDVFVGYLHIQKNQEIFF